MNPGLPADQTRRMLLSHWGVDGELAELGSLQDQNFLLTRLDGTRAVLKVVRADGDSLALQHAALRYLAVHPPGFACPVPIPTRDGRDVVRQDGYDTHLLSWVPGTPLADRGAMTERDLSDLGALAARATVALAGFTHPDMHREGIWDVRRCAQIAAETRVAGEPADARHLVDLAIESFRRVSTFSDQLPTQVVHTDVTPANAVCRAGQRSPSGILDFGDLVHTWRVADIVGTASDVAGHEGTEDALAAVVAVFRGYCSVCPLTEAEVEAIWPLVLGRTAVTYAVSRAQLRLAGSNRHAAQAADEALLALRRLSGVPECLAVAALRDAAGRAAYPPGADVATWLVGVCPAAMVAGLVPDRVDYLDLSVTSEVFEHGDWLDDSAVRGLVDGSRLTVSRWAECRLVDARSPGRTSPHNLQLGVGVFAGPGTEVRAPVDAVVHAVAAGEVILDLRPGGAQTYLAVSGLHPEAGLRSGARLDAGARLGAVAAAADGIGPCVQVQLRAEPWLPGRGQPLFRDAWLALCPDPSPLLGIAAAAPSPALPGPLRAARETHVARPQHLYYERPIEVVRGWRHFLYDAAGRPYLDMINNIASVGHSHPRVTHAAARQFRMLNTNSRFMYESMTRYSDRIADLLPPGLDRVFLVNSGSEAADLALQLAKVFTGRRHVVALRGAYHGWTGSVIAVSSSPQDGLRSKPDPEPWVHYAEQPDPYRGRFGSDASAYCDSVRDACAAAGGVAAFLSEPLLGNQGAVEPPADYLPAAYAIVRAAGGVCIADEVQVGMGRTGDHFWAFEHERVVPDIVYTAKATGNGHPLGVVVCRPDIADAFDAASSYFSSTGGGPVSCEIGLAVLDVIRDEGLQENARVIGAYLRERLLDMAGRYPIIGAVHGRGLYQGIDLVHDRDSKAPATDAAMSVSEHLRELGVVMQPTGDAFNVLKVKPPLCLDRAAADYFAAALETALRAVP